MKYSELIDIPKLQALMQSFSQVIGVANAIIDVDGTIIAHAGWQDACTCFHRLNAESCRRCIESETALVESMTQGTPYAVYRCHNGLIDAAASIIVAGEHVANVFTGQFLTASPDLDFFRQQARQFGFDEASYLAAIAKVPVLPPERVESITLLYAQFAGMLADNGLDRLTQKKAEADLANLNAVLEEMVVSRTQELHDSHEALRSILQTTQDGFWHLDSGARLLHVNPAYSQLSGYTCEELLGLHVSALEAKETPAATAEHISRLVATGSDRFESMHRRKDGSTWYVEISATYSAVADGQFFVFLRDISERKQAEEALSEQKEFFHLIAENLGDFIAVLDVEGRRLYNSPSYMQFYGSARDLVGTDSFADIHPEDQERVKQVFMETVQTGIGRHIEYRFLRVDGGIREMESHGSVIKDSEGRVTRVVVVSHDISERKTAAEKINELAFYDQLTGLPNRTLLLDRMRQTMTTSSRSDCYGALLLIDLDKFKTLNDTLGHDMGDLLLTQVAQRLTTCVRAGDTVARLGGDEFVVMLASLSTSEGEAATQTEVVGEKIRAALNQIYQLKSIAFHSTPSIGATLFKGLSTEIDDLLKQADLAMYKSKEAGRNALHFFDPDMEVAVLKRAVMEKDLRQAVQEQQFLLYYQAQVEDGQLTGVEALVRWQHPQRGMVSPIEFIPLSEETGLILPLGHWVLETACAQLAAWATRPEMAHLTVAVNVSAHQFYQRDFVDQVLAVLKKTGANPQRLKLELTESLLVDDVEDIIVKMNALKAQGVGFSLDDFGTGYSSLSYLKRLPLDQLKIDQSFVRDVFSDPNDASIAKTIIALAQSLGLGVIAEGVETAMQRDFLASSGCRAYQGYFFSRPLSLEGFEAFCVAGLTDV